MKSLLPLLLASSLAAAAPAAVAKRVVTQVQTITRTVDNCTEEQAKNQPTSTSHPSHNRPHSSAPSQAPASTFQTNNPSAPAEPASTFGKMDPSQVLPPPPPQQTSQSSPPSSHGSSSTQQSSGSNKCSLPGFPGATLPGATLPFCCTSAKPCGTPQAAGAEASFYEMAGGTGACGSSMPDSASFVAVSAAIMGSLSSGQPMNPLCGKTVTVRNTKTGKTASGPVVDKCPGCHTDYGIDLSHGLFDQLAAESDGVFPVEWWFDF